MRQLYKDERGFLGLVGLLFTLAIICYLFYILVNSYFKIPFLDNKAQKPSAGQGFTSSDNVTANYQPVMDSARSKIKDINKQLLNRGNQLEDIRNE